MISSAVRRRRAPRGSAPVEGPQLQVAPMLDMAFQLLAFFILTFEPPSAETRLDLYLPVAPLALPDGGSNQTNPDAPVEVADDLEIDEQLIVTARSDDNGGLAGLTLRSPSVGEVDLADAAELAERLTTYKKRVSRNDPLKVAFQADDRLLYDQAARILEACAASGVASIQLSAKAAAAEAPKP